MPRKTTKKSATKKVSSDFKKYEPLVLNSDGNYATRSQKIAHFLYWCMNNGYSGVYISPKEVWVSVFREVYYPTTDKKLRATYGHVKNVLRERYALGFDSSEHGIRALSSPEDIMEHQLSSDLKKFQSGQKRISKTVELLDGKSNQFANTAEGRAAKSTFNSIKKNVKALPSFNSYTKLLIQ